MLVPFKNIHINSLTYRNISKLELRVLSDWQWGRPEVWLVPGQSGPRGLSGLFSCPLSHACFPQRLALTIWQLLIAPVSQQRVDRHRGKSTPLLGKVLAAVLALTGMAWG